MGLTIFHYIIVSSIIFIIGLFGLLLNRKSIISLIMSIEIILLAININLVTFASYWQDFKGHILVLFILTVSAAEIAIVLVALVVYFNNRFTNMVDDINKLRG